MMLLYTTAIYFVIILSASYAKEKRSIDLIAAHSLITDHRLPKEIAPNSYHLELEANVVDGIFSGVVKINMTWQESSDSITLHSGDNIQIHSIVAKQIGPEDGVGVTTGPPFVPSPVKILDWKSDTKKQFLLINLEKTFKSGAQCEVILNYTAKCLNNSEGLFRSSFTNSDNKETKWFVATNFRPNLARKAFPCFDEPAHKVPVVIKIARSNKMVTLSNMPLENTEPIEGKPDWVLDTFQQTPPISTFSVSFVVFEKDSLVSTSLPKSNGQNFEISVWGRSDYIVALQNVTDKVQKASKILEEFWACPYPLPKLDLIALPNYQAMRPADNWGLLLFKESELAGKGSWHISQELGYQWLGSLATPYWWSDAHINNALVRYVTAYTTMKMDENETFNNWPMTMLYSIYYEFSKRYPHGKSTAIKQDSTSAKTELVFRMLNYTLGEKTFKSGLQKFMADRQYKTFFGDDIWSALSEQARNDKTLASSVTVNTIAGSWITKDRLPVINVTRNYQDKTATVIQRVYLRERPHDVPDQEKFVWWIPIVLIKQDSLNFANTTPTVWMKREREIKLHNLPDENQFIIINPEEIGPFPVNYDSHNWNKLAMYLQSKNRTKIPVNTRAKLLHDAWNLAYAGDLSFATALNMTLFLRYERDYLAWDPVFTLIDHIGRHIDSSAVHKKFQTYVRLLLTPLYEELGNEPQEGECECRAHLRSSSKVFLCQSGYKPCIEEAQAAFKKWMNSKNPDEGNPVPNQYICPVFKWGTNEEWEFGLQRIINFPPSRKANERTYLLKTLAGCPNDSEKIEKLLNITILEQNGNFTDNDVYLIFSMLTGGANGYTSLFNFLNKNWDLIKIRFKDKPQLWNSLITSATSVFKTQQGLDMVTTLYEKRKNEFGTADFVIEKSIKNIKEETVWSNENLPVIEKWLDEYLKNNNITK